jgi:non-heme chloroperoxidase
MAQITERETRQIDNANASERTPVVFIHGLWLLPSSWDNWAGLFEEAGYAPVTPNWPGDPETLEEARANPDAFAKTTVGQVADHTAEIIGKLKKKPAVLGHSTGGLLAQSSRAAASPPPPSRSTPGRSAECCRCLCRR